MEFTSAENIILILVISYIKNTEIDKNKWNACIEQSTNGSIHAYSYFLDAMSSHWDALVLNDYTSVMPLTWRCKYGFHYLYQPFFCAFLGIFSNNIFEDTVTEFLKSIPDKFKYCDIYLNRNNVFNLSSFPLHYRNNYILDLSSGFESIFSKYSNNHIRNLRKAERSGCIFKNNIDIEDVVALAKKQSAKFSPITVKDYSNFISLYKLVKKKSMAASYGVYNSRKELLASCVMFFSHNRAYYILVGNAIEGRFTGASHYMINEFIREHSGKNILLDFQGTQINSLARFYTGFGASLERYATLKFNRLPFAAKLIKK